ncbi:hypothetical protein [Halomonas sp. CSM-2]|uniref:hypothetical protein n=1 Tax=Halomonas sp. CSM-2 TaxID=1975722 RepID=UPI000A286D39|nr:hypothetical protein [Halomonas sp. CSM-2]
MDLKTILLAAACIVVIIGIVKGWGEDRSIIVFQDFDDLGLTFLVPASGFGIMILFNWMGANPTVGLGLGCAISLWLLVKVARNTHVLNGCDIGRTTLALATKLPLSLIWVLNFIQMLNPSGKTAAQRRSSRGQAMVLLAIFTPIIGALVVERNGSYFSPANWIKGRRVGSGIRDHLN